MTRNQHEAWTTTYTGECSHGICEVTGGCYFASCLYSPNNSGQLSSDLPMGEEGVSKGVFVAKQMFIMAAEYENLGCPNVDNVVGEIFAWSKSKDLPMDQLE